jgi:riboflavin kinase/FMN adenylyltransferase
VEVLFISRLRDERKFSGVEELKKQIQADIAAARRVLNP